jgi:hypothetical protein
MKANLIVVFLFCVSSSIILPAQTPIKKWDVSLAYGFGLPVSNFKKIAPEKSIYYFTTFPDINGFDKDGNSAAKNGTFGSFLINYQVYHSWGVQLRIGYTNNTVRTQPVVNYVNDVMGNMYGFIFSVSNNDYTVSYASIGVGYTFHFDKVRFSMYPSLGIGLLASPDYVLLDKTDPERLIPFSYEADQKYVESPLFGLAAAILYDLSPRIYAGCEVDYAYSNFDYSLTRKAPGFDRIYKSDRVTYRIVQLGIRAGFRF